MAARAGRLVPRHAGTSSADYQGMDFIEDRWLNEQCACYVRERET